jgi:hypothetical protein
MSKVFSALAMSVDGYITGRDPGPGRGLGDGTMLFDWYFDGDTPSRGVRRLQAERALRPGLRLPRRTRGCDRGGAQQLRRLRPLRRWQSPPNGPSVRPQPSAGTGDERPADPRSPW